MENTIMLPDLVKLTDNCEFHLHHLQPHYSQFLRILKKAIKGSCRKVLESYLKTIFYDSTIYIDQKKINQVAEKFSSIDSEEQIKELAQHSFRGTMTIEYKTAIEKNFKWINNVTFETEEELNSFKLVDLLIQKLFIIDWLSLIDSRDSISFTKPFVLQFLTELKSINENYVDTRIMDYIQNIRTPSFDKLMDESVQDENYFYWPKSVEILKKLEELLLEEKAIEENPNFIQSFKDRIVQIEYRTKWNFSKPCAYYLLYLCYGKKEHIHDGIRIDAIAHNLFYFVENKEKADKNYRRFQLHIEDNFYIEKKLHKITELYNKLF